MPKPQKTPASLGFFHPAEWEPHEATWIGWPAKRADWPGKFAPIPWVYGEIVRKIAPGELVRILVHSRDHGASARRVRRRPESSLSPFAPFCCLPDSGDSLYFGSSPFCGPIQDWDNQRR